MIKRSLSWFVFLLLLVGSLVAVLNVPEVRAVATYIKVSPGIASAEPGSHFKVNITTTDVQNLYGWQFYLAWNASLLTYVNVTEGPFIKTQTSSPQGTFFTYNVTGLGRNETTYWITAGCTTIGRYNGITGTGTLATVEFSANAFGDTALHLYFVKLRDSYQVASQEPTTGPPDYYFLNLVDGRFVNVGVPVASFTYTPSIPQISEEITFNASASHDTNTNGFIDEYFWDFGDVSNATDTDPFTAHTYTKGGSFTVSLTVTDNDNLTNTVTASIRIRYVHDIAVLRVQARSSTPAIGDKVLIDVTVSNEGLSVETFTVTAYVDSTAVGPAQDVLNLPSLQTQNLTFTWDTTGVTAGNYRIKAVASTVEDEPAAAQSDNTKLGGTVQVEAPSSRFPIELVIGGVVAAVVVIGVAVFFLRRRRGGSSKPVPPTSS